MALQARHEWESLKNERQIYEGATIKTDISFFEKRETVEYIIVRKGTKTVILEPHSINGKRLTVEKRVRFSMVTQQLFSGEYFIRRPDNISEAIY